MKEKSGNNPIQGKIESAGITLEKAWKIVKEFGKCLQNNPPAIYQFENVLPYEKEIILLSFITILKEEDFKELAILNNITEEKAKEMITMGLYFLDGYIPTPEQYETMVKGQKNINQAMASLKERQKKDVWEITFLKTSKL